MAGHVLNRYRRDFSVFPEEPNLLGMRQEHDYNLSVRDVATHFGLSARTVRQKLQDGVLTGVRLAGQWRCSWPDVWAAEHGPLPRGRRAELYKEPLLTKRILADKWGVSERTVERWIEGGLPTRNVFGSIRIAPVDADDWITQTFGIAKRAG